MKKIKRTLSQSFGMLRVQQDDEPELSGYQSATSPSSNSYSASNRISLPPQHSLTNLYAVPPFNDYNPAGHLSSSRGPVVETYDYPALNGEAARSTQTMQKNHLYSSSSFIDSYYSSSNQGNQPQNSGSQYMYYAMRPYATMQRSYASSSYHQATGIPNPHQSIQDSTEIHTETQPLTEASNSGNHPEVTGSKANGKPPLPRTPSKKLSLRSLKPGSRAASLADIFTIKRKKPSAEAAKNGGGPMRAMPKHKSTHEELFYSVGAREENSFVGDSQYATMNRTVHGGGGTVYLTSSNPGLNHTSTMPLHPQPHPHPHHLQQQPYPGLTHFNNNINNNNPYSQPPRHNSMSAKDMHAYYQQQLHQHHMLSQKPSLPNGAPPPPPPVAASLALSKSIGAVDRDSQMSGQHLTSSNEFTPVRYRPSKTRSQSQYGGGHDLYRQRYSVPVAPSFCSTNSFVANGGKYGKMENYKRLEILGEGSYATVYKGVSLVSGMEVALKEIRLNEEEGAPFTAIREASLLRELVHANIVKLHDIIYNTKQLIFVFEYLCTDLNHYLERYGNGGLNPHNVKLFLFQLLRGLSFIHDRKILHRDLKPQNLLISQHGELKLADFGLARAKSVPTQSYSNEVVTLWYRPPDILLGSTQYSTQLDMWGVGCIFCEMVSGLPTFPGVKDPRDQLLKIFRVLGTPDETTWPGVTELPLFKDFKKYRRQSLERFMPKLMLIPYAEELAESLLKCNPAERISARDSLQSKYFKNLPQSLFTLPDEKSIMFVDEVSLEAEREAPRNLLKTYYNP